MVSINSRRLRDAAIIAIGLGALIIIVLKAMHAAFTHDEATTFLNAVTGGYNCVPCCAYTRHCWLNANNHILNTFMMQITLELFGDSAFSLRLPNIVLGAAYVAAAGSIVRSATSQWLIAAAGMALLVLNPFVMDFFSLARGYGLALGLMFLSIMALIKLHQQPDDRMVVGAVVFACLSVFANLTYLIFAVAAIAFVSGIILLHHRNGALKLRTDRKVRRALVLSSIFLLLTAAYFVYPIYLLSIYGEFNYGALTVTEMWRDFMRHSLYGEHTLGSASPTILSVTILSLVSLSIAVAAWEFFRSSKRTISTHALVCSLALVVLFGFWLNHVLTGANWPLSRKTIIFQPLIALVIFCLLAKKTSRRYKIGRQFIAGAIAAFYIWTFIRATDVRLVREWWFDRYDHIMVQDVMQDCAEDESTCHMSLNWLFWPSVQFYIQTEELPLKINRYTHDLVWNDQTRYFYLYAQDTAQIPWEFEIHKQYDDRKMVIKRMD